MDDSAFCVCDCRTMHWSEEIGHWLCNGCHRLVERWIQDRGPNFPPDDDYVDDMDYSFLYDDYDEFDEWDAPLTFREIDELGWDIDDF